MEKIEYGTNGDDGPAVAVFNVIRTLSCERTRIKDAANNYLYTHWDFTVEVNWQPYMVAYNPSPFPNVPVATPGNLPGQTDLAILSYILQPRRRLKVTAGGSVILDTPALNPFGGARMPCDVTGGPSVEAVGVPVMIGMRHWIVTLHFIADVRDVLTVSDPSQNQNAIISNLWVATENVNGERRSVRHYAGRAILRADVMRDAKVNANTFRDLYLFPCPLHYQRQNVSAKLSEDGTILEWSFEDEMRGYDLGAKSPILDIECFQDCQANAGSPLNTITQPMRTFNQGVADNLFNPIGLISAAAAIPGNVVRSVQQNIPKYHHHIRCDVTGDRNADLGALTGIALGVCFNKIGLSNIGAMLTGTAELIMRQDIADQVYASAELTIRWTDDALFAAVPVAAAVGGLPAALGVLQAGGQQMVNRFLQDSRTLNVAAGFGQGLENPNWAASREGKLNSNPPLLQGAFGVVPNQAANVVVSSTPMGAVPVGVEKFIVQALLGWNVAPPPQPGSLATES